MMLLFLRVLPVAVALALAGAAGTVCAQQPPDEGARTLDTPSATTPAGLAARSASDAGWFDRTWDGTKRIASEGDRDFYLSGMICHMPYACASERRGELDEAGSGGGLGKFLRDARDNQHML